MKQLTIKVILPLTIISFATITKWWYTLPVDAPDTMFSGFPLPFVCDGWHTSGSLQIFLAELTIDLLTYFLFWFILIFSINRFLIKINPHKILTIGLWVLAGLVISGAGLIASNSDNLYYIKRKFDFEIMETGYKFVWQQPNRPDYFKYHPKDKKE
jgi:membrane-associated phospholipid phosphatase